MINLYTKPKLRTCVLFKENYCNENSVKYCMSRQQRSLIAQLRLGTLLIHREIGYVSYVIHKKLRVKFILFANVNCIMISEKLCIGQLNINILIFICMIIKTNLYF